MKRIFTLLSTILVALTSYAQLEITDEAGKVIENGGTIEFKAEALNGSTFSIKGINLAMPNEYNDFWKYLRDNLGVTQIGEATA